MGCIRTWLPTKTRKEAGAQPSSSLPSHERGSIVACSSFRISQLRSAFTFIAKILLPKCSWVPGTVELHQRAGGYRIGTLDNPPSPQDATGYRGPRTGDEVAVCFHAINIGRGCGEADHRVGTTQELDRRDDEGIRGHRYRRSDIGIARADAEFVEGGQPPVTCGEVKPVLSAKISCYNRIRCARLRGTRRRVHVQTEGIAVRRSILATHYQEYSLTDGTGDAGKYLVAVLLQAPVKACTVLTNEHIAIPQARVQLQAVIVRSRRCIVRSDQDTVVSGRSEERRVGK